MSKPMRTNNPSEWTALDGIYIDELSPPAKITSKGRAVVALVGKFQMGPYDAITIGSSGHYLKTFGKGNYGGYKAVRGKTFSALVVQRVKAGTDSKAAFGILVDDTAITPGDSIKGEAIYEGDYGNVIKMTASKVLNDPDKFNLTATFGSEIKTWENLTLASFPLTCSFAKFIKAEGATKIPNCQDADQTVTFTQGSDGIFTDADYVTALAKLEAKENITIIFTDDSSVNVNLALISHCNLMGDRIPIFHEAIGTTVEAAITAASGYRAALDRGILAFPWLYQYDYDNSVLELNNPAAWAASLISQIPEEWDPAVTDAAKYLAGVRGLELNELGRQHYIDLKNAGIMAFEFDEDYGYKIKSGVTISTDQAKCMIFRRRMSDMLTKDISSGLKPFQNKIQTQNNKDDALAAVTNYLQDKKDKTRIEDFRVDGESMNTEISNNNGEFHILVLVKLYSSMRYIILHAQIGETVTITEERGAA